MSPWTAVDIPDQTGRTAVVTGANSGLGLQTSRQLARFGAHVVLACRDKATRAAEAMTFIRSKVPDASLSTAPLDLADLASVRTFAAATLDAHPSVDLLINNAGIMAVPYRRTADGFEGQFGTNHLGHFALTGLLLPALLATPGSRVVTVSSGAAAMGRMHFDDLQGEGRYHRWLAYGQSKLANLLFAFELARRLAASGSAVVSAAAHPGYAATNLQSAGPREAGNWLAARFMELGNAMFAQSDAQGALAARSTPPRRREWWGATTSDRRDRSGCGACRCG